MSADPVTEFIMLVDQDLRGSHEVAMRFYWDLDPVARGVVCVRINVQRPDIWRWMREEDGVLPFTPVPWATLERRRQEFEQRKDRRVRRGVGKKEDAP